MKRMLLLSLLLLAGCATEPTLTIKADSKPQGVEVYAKGRTRGGRLGIEPLRGEMGLNGDWVQVGTTPFKVTWTLPLPDDLVDPLTLEAKPAETDGLYRKRVVCDSSNLRTNGNSRTCIIFFDLTKP